MVTPPGVCAHTHTYAYINIIVARLGSVQLSITGIKTPKYYQLSINFTISETALVSDDSRYRDLSITLVS